MTTRASSSVKSVTAASSPIMPFPSTMPRLRPTRCRTPLCMPSLLSPLAAVCCLSSRVVNCSELPSAWQVVPVKCSCVPCHALTVWRAIGRERKWAQCGGAMVMHAAQAMHCDSFLCLLPASASPPTPSAGAQNEKDELKAAGWKQESSGAAAGQAPADPAAYGAASGGASMGPGATQEKRASNWNELQRQMKGKGFTQEQIKDMYKQGVHNFEPSLE